MPSFLDPKKYPERKIFYRGLFYNKDLYFPSYPGLVADFEAIGIKYYPGENHLGQNISVFIHDIQYLLIDQDPALQNTIVERATTKLISFLQNIFKNLYPLSPSDGLAEYWAFIQASLQEAILTDYNKKTVQEYKEGLCFYACLATGFDSFSAGAVFKNWLEKLAACLDLNANEKKISTRVWAESMERIKASYRQITSYSFLPSLSLIAITAVAWYYGLPYSELGLIATLGSAGYALLNPQLTQEAQEFFYQRGKQAYYEKKGKNPDEDINSRKKIIAFGIEHSFQQFKANTRLSLKLQPAESKDKPAQEVHVLIYDEFPRLDFSPRLKKIKAKALTQENPFKKIIQDKIKREAQVRENFEGQLLEGPNHSLTILKPQTGSETAYLELKEQMGPRSKIISKNGQSFWLRKGGKKVPLQPTTPEEVLVDGKNQTVPAFQPKY